MRGTKIVQKENEVLRQKTHTVKIADIATAKTKKLIASLSGALDKEDDGVAIAAPQIGVPMSVFVVSGKVFDMIEKKSDVQKSRPDLVCINPEILKTSRKKQWMEEGCLSVRWLYGRVERALKVKLSAHDEHGKKFTMGASGLLAQIFQHEVDHLHGILFTDKAKDVTEMPPQKIKKP